MAKKKFKFDKHFLTPKHLKLSEKEKTALLQKYNATLKELPKILKGDAAISNLSAEVGDVVKVIRKSHTAGESVYYRVVSDV